MQPKVGTTAGNYFDGIPSCLATFPFLREPTLLWLVPSLNMRMITISTGTSKSTLISGCVRKGTYKSSQIVISSIVEFVLRTLILLVTILYLLPQGLDLFCCKVLTNRSYSAVGLFTELTWWPCTLQTLLQLLVCDGLIMPSAWDLYISVSAQQ